MKPAAKTILIAGCGDIGTRLGLQLAAQGWKVYAVRRNPAALPSRFFSIRADLGDPESLRALPGGADFVLYTATAARFDEAHYRAVYVDGVRNVLAASPSPNFFFVSSSAVYGQDDGAWVNEQSPTAPRHFNGRVMLEGEHVVRAHGGVCVRFSGIYGPRRTRLVDTVRRGQPWMQSLPSSSRSSRSSPPGIWPGVAVCALWGVLISALLSGRIRLPKFRRASRIAIG